MKYGIDLSSWQSNIDYGKVAENSSFAILRVGYGVSYLPNTQKDSKFEEHYNNLSNKMPIGAYYYQYADEIGEGKREAENCLKYLGGKKLELPIFYDVEDGSLQGLNKEKLSSIIREFVDTIKSAGYEAGIYASKHWINNKIDLSKFNDCKIWCAVYGTNNGELQEDAKYSGRHEIWQYTSRGYIGGVEGFVDMYVFYEDIQNTAPDVKPPEIVYSGDKNIVEIQTWLNENYGYNVKVDGYYGVETKKYLLMALQHELNVQFKVGISEDGIWGTRTYNSLINVKQGARGNITHIIQAMLYCKGYNTNGVDGIFGKGTTSAVRTFQANNQLSVDGIVGRDTFKSLFK